MTTSVPAAAITLDGASLSLSQLAAIARDGADVRVTEDALGRLDRVRDRLLAARADGAVYGANTGVGANRGVSVAEDDIPEAHAQRLLHSHCAAIGPIEDDVTARATMAVRLNQFLAGGSGISSRVANGLVDALNAGAVPTLHRLGAIGTADLAALAELALTLTGERPWARGGIPPVAFTATDALPFMSSSAVTLATSALATRDLRALLEAAIVVSALSFLALRGSAQAYDGEVMAARPHPHQEGIARLLRDLIGSADAVSARLQDPFGLRVVPQVHAPAVLAVHQLADVVRTEINSASENPLVTMAGVRHHGQFHLAMLTAQLDNVRTSVYPALTLSAARLGLLLRPEMTGLAPFLASDAPGSSGMMITEYVVQDLLARLRTVAAPVSGASVSISFGMEEHASFASQGARLLGEFAASAPTVIAIEAVAAVRALRMAPERLRGSARAAFDLLAAELSAEVADRPLGADIERATALLPALRQFVGDGL